MRRPYVATAVSTALLTGTLLVGLTALSPARPALARATGVIATVSAIDARTGMATLTTETGEQFTLPKGTLWRVGTRVECDRVEDAPQLRLQSCQPW